MDPKKLAPGSRLPAPGPRAVGRSRSWARGRARGLAWTTVLAVVRTRLRGARRGAPAAAVLCFGLWLLGALVACGGIAATGTGSGDVAGPGADTALLSTDTGERADAAGDEDASLPLGDLAAPPSDTSFAGDGSGQDDTAGETVGPDIPPPPLALLAVDPPRGAAAGGEYVRLTGTSFPEGCGVLFGESLSPAVFRVSAEEITAETPPGPPGLVDVTLACPELPPVVLADGFLYFRAIVLRSIEPSEGPATGGTPVTVRGTGFRDGALLSLGGRRAIRTDVLDDQTLIAVTPPGAGGHADVHLSQTNGVAVLRRGYFYARAPRIDAVLPPLGPTSGGAEVTIRGAGFTGTESVWFGGAQALSLSVGADAELRVTTPTGAAGPVELRVYTPHGVASRPGGYVYRDGDPREGPLRLLAVTPVRGTVLGGERVALVATGLPADGDLSVLFGTGAATVEEVLPEQGLAWLRSPPSAIDGPVEVAAQSAGGLSALPDGFIYERALAVGSITPASGPAEGGTPITILGTGFAAGAQVFLGALPATGVNVVELTRGEESRIQARSPEGSPGNADVRVVQGGASAILPDGYLFEAPFALDGVVPELGAVAGGTLVTFFGAGFTEETEPTIDGRRCTHVRVLDPTRIEAKSPPGEIGTVGVAVERFGEERRGLVDAFTYFDPMALFGGTWGGPVEGSVNVTVLDANGAAPLADAYVILWTDPDTPYQGWTNTEGQITFSGPDVFGEQMVSASKECYASSSVVAFDATNLTLVLRYNCMSMGGGPPPGIPPAVISGRVVGLDKYVIPPPGDCTTKPAQPVLCQPCLEDADCAEEPGAVCADMDPHGSFCATPCGLADPADPESEEIPDELRCPEGYTCTSRSPTLAACLPDGGTREATCRATRPYALAPEEPPPGPLMTVGSDRRYQIYTRYGEIAIVCIAGVRDDLTGTFTPMRMGTARHVQPSLDQPELDEVDVYLDIPLTGSLELRADDVTLDAVLGPQFLYSFVFLDLGSDGVWDFEVESYTFAPSEPLAIPYLPESFAGSIYDASYTVLLGAFSQLSADDNTPYSITQRSGIRDVADDSVLVRGAGGRWGVESTGMSRDVHGLWGASDDDVWAVGARGLLSHYNGAFWSPQPVDTGRRRLNGIWGADGGELVVVGEQGIALTFDGTTWERSQFANTAELRAVWGFSPDDVYAVGQYSTQHWDGEAWTELTGVASRSLYSVWGASPDRLWAVGQWGTILYFDGNGWQTQNGGTSLRLRDIWGSAEDDVFVVGESGVILHWDGEQWLPMDSGTTDHLHAVWGRGPDDVFAAGTRGVLLHWDGSLWRDERLRGYTNALDALWGAASGSRVYAMGNHELLLGPFLSVPRPVNPPEGGAEGGTMIGDVLEWALAPEPTEADLTLVFIDIPSFFGDIPIWDFTAEGTATAVTLPDFEQIAGTPGLPGGGYKLTILRGFKEGLDIDGYDFLDLDQTTWRSWSMDVMMFTR